MAGLDAHWPSWPGLCPQVMLTVSRTGPATLAPPSQAMDIKSEALSCDLHFILCYYVFIVFVRSFISSKITTNSINSVYSEDVKLKKNTKRTINSNTKVSFSNTYSKSSRKISNSINTINNFDKNIKKFYTLNYLGSFKGNNDVEGFLYSRCQ